MSRLKRQCDKHLKKLGKAAEVGEPFREGLGMFRVPGQAKEARGNVRKGWTLGKTTAAAATTNPLIGWGFLFPFSAVLTSHISGSPLVSGCRRVRETQ